MYRMGATRLLVVSELRRRWLSLAAIALTVGFVSGAVTTALAGARRTNTSIERFRDWAHASDGNFQTSSLEEAAPLRAFLARRSEVVAVAQRRLVNGFLLGRPISDIALVTDPEGRYGVVVDRPRLLVGRFPAPDASDEIMLNELAGRLAGVRVGGVLRIKTWSEKDLEALFGGNGFPGFNGPRVEVTVVGIARMLDGLPGDVGRTSPYGITAPAFLAVHRGVGAWPPAVYVRTRNGEAFAKLSAAVGKTRVPGVDNATYSAGSTARTEYLDASQKAADSATWALFVFAAAAALVGALVIGQAVLRHLTGASPPEILAQLGMTRTDTARAFTIPVLVAAVIGAIAGALLAVLASPLLPIGLARRAEIAPGIWIDPLILLGCVTLAVALVAAFAFLAARQTFARSRDKRSHSYRTPAAVRAAKRAGAPPVVDIGIRFAAERHAGARAFPVRTVFAGLAVAVASIAAAGVVSTSFARLAHQPARWGWNWSSEPDHFGSGDMSVIEQRLVRDDRVAGVGELVTGSVTVEGVETSGWAMKSVKGDMAMTLRRGRLPAGANEIALGEDTVAHAKTRIGGTVRIAAPDAPTSHSFMIVGTVVFRSQSEEPVLNAGAAFTPEGFASVVRDKTNIQSSIELRYPHDANAPELEAALTKDYGLEFNAFTMPQVPGVIRHLSETRTVAIALALFFAVLGTLALAHTLVVGTGRRRRQLAVFRVLGFRPVQVRGAIVVQAIALGLAAVVVGLPAGIVLGRFVWRVLTNGLGGRNDPATPWIVIATAIPVTVLWATVLASWPAWRAGRTPVAESLHVE